MFYAPVFTIKSDPLTKLFNQIHMSSLITSKLKKLESDKKEIFSLIYIDIDDFNHFSKQHGISASESALKKLAFLINRSIRDEDVLSRWSTSVFIALCPVIKKDDINKMAKSIRESINKAPFASGSRITCSISMTETLPSESKNKNNLISELQNKIVEINKLKKNSIVSVDGRLLI